MSQLANLMLLINSEGAPASRKERLASVGRGPYSRKDFNEAVNRYSGGRVFTLKALDTGSAVVVGDLLSAVEWDAFWELVERRPGEPLRVYSQEMYVGYLLTGTDVFEDDPDLLSVYAEGHRALTAIMARWTDWRTGICPDPSDDATGNMTVRKAGFLSLNGYTTRLSAAERQRVLGVCYESGQRALIWPASPPDDRTAAGSGRSGARLQYIHDLILGFIELRTRMANKQGKAIPKCVTVWTTDHEWMRDKFYVKGTHNFDWKSARIR
jgi:hypothetical protein